MTEAEYKHQMSALLDQLVTVCEAFPRSCVTEPCGQAHYHFAFPATIPPNMCYWVSLAYEIKEVGWDLWVPRKEPNRTYRFNRIREAVDGWRAFGIIR